MSTSLFLGLRTKGGIRLEKKKSRSTKNIYKNRFWSWNNFHVKFSYYLPTSLKLSFFLFIKETKQIKFKCLNDTTNVEQGTSKVVDDEVEGEVSHLLLHHAIGSDGGISSNIRKSNISIVN